MPFFVFSSLKFSPLVGAESSAFQNCPHEELPELPAIEVCVWPETTIEIAVAITCLRRVGSQIPFQVMCPDCREEWRWDRQGSEVRVCPRCFGERREDCWDEDEEEWTDRD
jgi:hypothetical protein